VSEKSGPAVVQSEGAPVAEKDVTGVTTIENKTT
jgi:hypothetical protein